jgi:NADH-quinone oxidoreductase subunit C
MTPSLEQLVARFTQLTEPRPAPAPGAADAAAPAGPVQVSEPGVRGCQLDVALAPRQVVLAAEILDQAGFSLDAVTGVDWPAQAEMEVVYDYFHPLAPLRVAVRARVPRGEPELPTISAVFPGANWHERETHDFFGIRFAGHPNLTPLLLPEDADYHPLRKDFSL